MRPSRLLTAFALLALFLVPAVAKEKTAAKAAAKPAAEASAGDPTVLATVGDAKITRGEVEKNAAAALQKVKQQEYEALRGALDRMIDEQLLDAAAKKAGKANGNEWLAGEITKRLTVPTDAEIEAAYNQQKARLGGATLEQSKPNLISMLQSQQQARVRGDVLKELRANSTVKVMLEPPRIQVADSGPSRGPKDAPVTIIEFSDYQCPYCSRAEATMNQIRSVYGDRVRIVFRDFPLSFHQNAQKAAEAAGCALEQNKFWELHEKMFANQGALDVENLRKAAGELGLDRKKFDECLDSGRRAAEIKKDQQEAQLVGVTGTPGFFVNGRFVNGAQPFDNFARLIDEELTMRNLPIPPKPVAAAAPVPPAAGAAPVAVVKPAAAPAGPAKVEPPANPSR